MTITKRQSRKASTDSEAKRAAFAAMAAELAGELKEGKHTERLATAKTQVPGIERYSELNQLLILKQCPHATEVHTYPEWQRLGFQVRRGEHGFAIRAPRPTSGGEGEEGRVSFRTIHVFDTSQVGPIPDESPEYAAYIHSLGENEDFE